jgi:hypothetical protein
VLVLVLLAQVIRVCSGHRLYNHWYINRHALRLLHSCSRSLVQVAQLWGQVQFLNDQGERGQIEQVRIHWKRLCSTSMGVADWCVSKMRTSQRVFAKVRCRIIGVALAGADEKVAMKDKSGQQTCGVVAKM